MLKAEKEQIHKTYTRDNEPWCQELKEKSIQKIAAQYKATGKMPTSGWWVVNHKSDAEYAKWFAEYGVDVTRIASLVNQQKRYEQFRSNYFARSEFGNMPRADEEDYAYYAHYMADAVFLAKCLADNINVNRAPDVVRQEAKFEEYKKYAIEYKELPKEKRERAYASKKEELSGALARWERTVRKGIVKCIVHCRFDLRAELAAFIKDFKAKEKAEAEQLKAQFRNAERRGTEYLRLGAKLQYDTDLREYVVQEL
ncbi:MAG: hypothetical protein LBD99_04790 [Candidatus Margulisbacteria bacterium]|jgi:hypothetical protein|nr:hypothetical protein [Candidatus Margulisiibacteriota bacterium]